MFKTLVDKFSLQASIRAQWPSWTRYQSFWGGHGVVSRRTLELLNRLV